MDKRGGAFRVPTWSYWVGHHRDDGTSDMGHFIFWLWREPGVAGEWGTEDSASKLVVMSPAWGVKRSCAAWYCEQKFPVSRGFVGVESYTV